MSKAATIRTALPTSAAKACDAAQLTEITGIKNVGPHLSGMIKNREVITEGERGSLRYWRDPDYQPKRRTGIDDVLPLKRKKKKNVKKPRGGAMPASKVKSLRQIARRVATAPGKPQASRLALENLKAAGAHLANTVRVEVEGVENNPTLAAALEQHERAAALVEALA